LWRQPNCIDPSSRFRFRYRYEEREARGLELLLNSSRNMR
jgi:hypothetical protein